MKLVNAAGKLRTFPAAVTGADSPPKQ
jgi:hypothetical protein